MRISAPGNRTREGGFTLVELMVVVTVIALASAVAVLAIPDPRGALAEEAARFALRVRAAHDLAIVDGQPTSVWVGEGGYGFDARRAGAWTPMADAPFRVEQWKEGTAPLRLDAARVRVSFDSTGLPDRPLDVVLARARARATVRIAGDGGVRVE